MSRLLQAFAEGLLNPILVPAHALALCGLGLFIGQQASRALAVLSFTAGLAGGLTGIALAVGPTPSRIVLLADAALIAGLVASAWAPPRPVGWLFAAIAGAAIALDSPPQAPTIAQGNATLVGTGVGACALLLLVSACAALATRRWQQLGLRIVGSWIAASAILVLAVMLR